MNSNFNPEAQPIFKDIFVFSGLLSSEGYLLNLQGQVFDEAGVEPELLVGHKFSETVFWQFEEQTSEILQKAIDQAGSGSQSKPRLNFRVNAQKILTVELNLIPQSAVSGNHTIFFGAIDVTEQQREINYYKTRSEHFLYAAEAAETGLWFWDLTKDEIFTTPKCNEFYQLPPNEIVTYQKFINTLHPKDSARVVAELQRAQTTDEEYNIEYRVIYSDQSIQWLNVRGKTFFDDEKNPVSMMGVARKITERKLASDELLKINEAVLKAKDEAEEANRAKDYFLAIVSHELRSPLNAILGWTKILLTKEVDENVRRGALETIERSAKSQAKLIEDLVDSSRIASGKLRLELRPVSLYKIIQNAFTSQKPAAAAKNIQFDLTADTEQGEIYGDSARLQQVFTNLLTNALKFTPEGGRVRINFSATPYLATVTIEDNGQGISRELLPKIFKQFAQAGAKESRDRSGLGLGLVIVKTLVEKHGGSIKAESRGVGRGAKFSVALPLIAATANDFPNDSKSADESHLLDGIKVLVVEDDEDSREVLQLFLEQSGAQVESAESAAEAWKLLTKSEKDIPDIIVSDLAMPVEDGYSFISKVRHLNREEINEIPAMALSAFTSNENKQKAYACGFQLYHTKPFEPDGIVKDILLLVKKGQPSEKDA